MCICIYVYIYIYIYVCIYIYIYTNIPQIPSSLLTSLYAFLLTARVALTVSRGGSYARRLIRLVRLVLDPWRYQVAKGAFSAGPDLGSFSSQRSALGTDPIWVRNSRRSAWRKKENDPSRVNTSF